MKKIIYLNIKIIGLVLTIFALIFYFRPTQAQPASSVIQLQVCGVAGSCGYGTSLNLGSQGASSSTLIFSGSFSDPFRCDDLNGQTTDRSMTIQSSNLVNQNNSNYIIPADNVELQNTAAHVVGGNCPIDQGTTSWTPIGSTPATILGKTYSISQSCKVQADTVSLRVTTLSGQEVGHYSGELTITYSNFDDTIDCRSAVDPNCTSPDITFSYGGAIMRRAGCNSTLGSGTGITYYGENNQNSEVYNCLGTNLGNLSQFYSSTGKEINIASGCKIDNIFGKLYARYPEGSGLGSDLACGFGRHVPSDSEWKILEQTYGMHQGINSNTGGELYIENYLNDQYGSNGERGTNQGRSGTDLWLLTRDLGFPLAGDSALGITYNFLGMQGYYRTQTLSGGSNNMAWMRLINYNRSQITRNNVTTSRDYSVRCVRNSNCPSNFVCNPGERCEVDSSCCNHDIQFTYGSTGYTRAGCNSTLGDMVNDSSIMDFNGISKFDCNNNGLPTFPDGFNYTEIGLGGSCKIKNNFGKLYQWDDRDSKGLYNNCKGTIGNNFIGSSNNYNCPCPDGRHVPNSSDWDKLKDYHTSIGGINGRAGNQSGLTRNLQMPLVGYCTSLGSCFGRGVISYYRGANNNGSDGDAGMIYYNLTGFSIINRYIENYNPVRCIKD